MPQEKLPVETVSLKASLTKAQNDEIIKWYFRNFLNKEVSSVEYDVYSNALHRINISCTDIQVPVPTRTVEQIKSATKSSTIVID